MWKKITINNRSFVIKTTVREDEHEIMVCDFRNVWTEALTKDQLLKRCKEMNPLYEVSSNILTKKILDLIKPEQDNVRKELLEVGNQLTIVFSSQLKGFIFKFKFILVLATSEKLYQNLTIPLIQIIEELHARQKILCQLLVSKDAEINEYQLEGAHITRKHVLTQPFNEEEFFRNFSNNGEERALKNLQCPFTFFEKSCADMYEECKKRTGSMERILSLKKVPNEDQREDNDDNAEPEVSKRKKGNEVIFDDNEDEADDDETYFPTQVKPTIKQELKERTIKKKKKLNL